MVILTSALNMYKDPNSQVFLSNILQPLRRICPLFGFRLFYCLHCLHQVE